MSSMGTRVDGRLLLVLVVLATIAGDRVTKHVATRALAGLPGRSFLTDTVRIGYVENTGGFLGLGANLPAPARTALFTTATGLMLLALAVLAARREWDRWSALGLTLFITGGASNWIDRLVSGKVVDFLNVGIGPVRTGVFNLADMAITLGAGLVILARFRAPGAVGRSRNDEDNAA